jgi:acyl-CoA dehydrogenase
MRTELRHLVRRFTEREVVPYLADWERAGEVPRSLHRTAGELGLLGAGFPVELGGGGGDLLDTATISEQIILSGGSSGLIAASSSERGTPHLVVAGDPGLSERYARPTLAGERSARDGD